MALCQKAFALELEEATSQSSPSSKQIVALESHFEDVYMDLQPTPQDYQARKVAVDFVNGLARDKLSVGNVRKQYGLCNARAFGSFTMDMFTSTSDLDISLNVELGLEAFTREDKVKLLKKLTKLLYGLQSKGFVREIQPVFRAKVPVVKFLHCNTGIECDVSIENKDGIIKSEFLRIFSSIDSRFRKLCFLFKAWANGHGINSSKDHTLNSLSIILLVAFHLQTRVPAILPPFSMLLKGVDTSTASHAVSFVQQEVNTFKDFGKKNSESVVQLFNSFLTKIMAVKHLWHEGLCASAYEGTWTVTTDPSWIFVEDFSSLSQNAARAVDAVGFDAIYECCNHAFLQLKSYFLGKHEAQVLKSSLFNLHTTSAVHKRKRNMEDHPDSGNHQPMQGSMIQQSVAEDKRKILSYAPSSRFYDSRFGQMMPGETILNRASVLARDYLAQVTQSTIDSYLVPTVNSGLLREHPPKRMRLQPPISGDRYLFPSTDLKPLPERLLRDDQFYPSNIQRRLQSAGQQSYLLTEPRIGMHDQRDLLGAEQTYPGAHPVLLPPFTSDGVHEQRDLLGERKAEQTYLVSHRVLPPPFSSDGVREQRDLLGQRKAEQTYRGAHRVLPPPFTSHGVHEQMDLLGQRKAEQTYLGAHRMLPPPFTSDGVHEQRDLLGEREAEETYPGAHRMLPPSFTSDGLHEQRDFLGQRKAEQTYPGAHRLLLPPFTSPEQRDLLGERTAEQTYPRSHRVHLPPFTNDGIPLYTVIPKGLNQSRYSNQVPLHGYGFKMYDG